MAEVLAQNQRVGAPRSRRRSDEAEDEGERDVGKRGVLRIGRCDGEDIAGGEINGGSHREGSGSLARGKLHLANWCAVLEQSEGGRSCRRDTGNGAAERGAGGKTRGAAENMAQDHPAACRLPGGEVGQVIRWQGIQDVASFRS